MSEMQAFEAANDENGKEGRMPRRTFLFNSIAGAAGLPLLLQNKGAAAAESNESGRITLDALMLTYFSAPLGSLGSSSWTIRASYATTFRVSAPANPDLKLKARVPEGKERFDEPAFRQTNSTQVRRAITLRRRLVRGQLERAITPAPGIPDNTVFYGLLRPQLRLSGNSKRLRFRVLKADAIFLFGLAALQSDDPAIREIFSQSTLDSFAAQYVTEPAALTDPRFELRANLLLPAGVKDVFTFTESRGSVLPEQNNAVVTATIVGQSGFQADVLKQVFPVGGLVEITYAPVQEFESNEIIRVDTSLERREPGISRIYWDTVFKTFVIIDAGPVANFGQPVVQGRVTDGAGLFIPGALVRLNQNGVDYGALTDNFGNYVIATPSGQPLLTGEWTARCGDVVQDVYVREDVTSLDITGVSLQSALGRRPA